MGSGLSKGANIERFDSQESLDNDEADVDKRIEKSRKNRLNEILQAPKIPRIVQSGGGSQAANRTLQPI